MTNFILKFGKHKGQEFNSTPLSYQNWLLNQDWFKMPTELTPLQSAQKTISVLSNQINGWDGHSKKGAAIYDAMFDAEQVMDEAVETERKYFGMNEETKKAQMDWDYAEISACNMIDNYYNY